MRSKSFQHGTLRPRYTPDVAAAFPVCSFDGRRDYSQVISFVQSFELAAAAAISSLSAHFPGGRRVERGIVLGHCALHCTWVDYVCGDGVQILALVS